VAAYVLVIALMAAQAIGRATVLRTSGALWVAVGAGFFMLSDTLLALNKFVSPLPLSQLWVLSTYYIAQVLIVRGLLADASTLTSAQSSLTSTSFSDLAKIHAIAKPTE
jgi:alkylglycerol monooxygenase